MVKWQNLEMGFFEGVGKYNIPEVKAVTELPDVDRFVEFDYCLRLREDRHDRSKLAVHFFEDDYKFERVWTGPDRYGEMLSKFAYVIGPDFSQYVDFPLAVSIYNHYRNMWLTRYWQEVYDITVVPTVMWGFENTYDWCFDGYPKNSVVAVSNVGLCQDKEMKKMFFDGYDEMMKRLSPTKILMFSRNFEKVPGNVHYIRWEIHKGDQLNGNR